MTTYASDSRAQPTRKPTNPECPAWTAWTHGTAHAAEMHGCTCPGAAEDFEDRRARRADAAARSAGRSRENRKRDVVGTPSWAMAPERPDPVLPPVDQATATLTELQGRDSPALCRPGVDDVDPEWWFSDIPADRSRAMRVCARCPVQDACLQAAVENPRLAEFGIWGGADEVSRRAMRRRFTKAPRPISA